MKEKIKLNYNLQISKQISFDEIEKEVNNLKSKKESDLSYFNKQDIFEVVINVTMPEESIEIR